MQKILRNYEQYFITRESDFRKMAIRKTRADRTKIGAGIKLCTHKSFVCMLNQRLLQRENE